MSNTLKVNVITLGCAKNVVDSEHIMAQLAAAGWKVVFDSNETDAKVVIINTCGFIGDAKEESVETILNYAAAKTRGEIERLYVIGCLSERYRDELREELPEVDEFFGARTIDDVVCELVGEWRNELSTTRLLSTPSHYAYLKIGEGCNWRCGYCAIPLIRGRHRSVPMETLLDEARRLAAGGVRELIVIAQDTTYYGLDLYGERRLAALLRELCRIDGIEWVRLHYTYPAGFPDDVIAAMAEEPKICKYIDIPLQHIADSQLDTMHRGISGAQTRELIGRLRRAVPGIAIRTTLLVGYPGETERDFAELLDFVRAERFERLGVFAYSEEEGTFSAENLADDVPAEVKERRVEEVMRVQAAISLEHNMARVGSTERVVVDRREGDFWVARSQWESPEVDGEILIADAKPLKIGSFHTVRITSAEDYDLFAELCM
jgi:ribosomal protein S12 methylthiotransferase